MPEHDEAHLRWQILLENLAGIDEQLAAEYLERIDGGARYYDNVPDQNDLKESARNAFRYLLGCLLERPLSDELIAFPTAVGALRARQGIALENLSAAVRSDFLVAWSALLRLADDTDMRVLAMHVGQLWKVVDDFAGAVQQGYLDQRLQTARTNIIEQQQSLSDLFSGEPSPAMVHRAAEVLGLDETASYWVVGLTADGVASAVTRRLVGLDVVALEHMGSGVTLILLSAHSRWPDDEALAADLLCGVTGAVAPRTVQLQNAFRSAATVRMLAQLGVEATTLRRSWSKLSVAQLCT
ncbi:MAG: helix-turn-helix domain-containing protein, partial [Mycobacterium sp.]